MTVGSTGNLGEAGGDRSQQYRAGEKNDREEISHGCTSPSVQGTRVRIGEHRIGDRLEILDLGQNLGARRDKNGRDDPHALLHIEMLRLKTAASYRHPLIWP